MKGMFGKFSIPSVPLSDRRLNIVGLIIGVFGIVLSVWGLILTVHANNQTDRAYELQNIAEKTTLQATLEKIVFSGPPGGVNELEAFSDSQMNELFNVVYADTNSQMQNQYLVSNPKCYQAWNDFREFLVIEIQSSGFFRASGRSVALIYYSKRDAVVNSCGYL